MTMQEFIQNNKKNDDFRYEFVNGIPVKMMSATIFHELIITKMITQFGNYLENKKCEVFGSNLAIKISEDTFRVPDISIICDFNNVKGDDPIYEGSPNLIVEIKSPSNDKRYMDAKKQEYHSIGVKEYWVIYNEYRVEVNLWREYGYDTILITSNEKDELCIPVHLSEWDLIIKIDLNKIPEKLRTNILYTH